MLEDVEALIRDHRVRGSSRRWESNGIGPWDRCIVAVGQVEDGRWYVERDLHPRIGPWRGELYATETDALTVAREVMVDATRQLGGRAFVEVGVLG